MKYNILEFILDIFLVLNLVWSGLTLKIFIDSGFSDGWIWILNLVVGVFLLYQKRAKIVSW